MKLVLASASPARLETLRGAGVEPRVQVSHVDEDSLLAAARLKHESDGGALAPSDAVLVLARAKAEAVAGTLDESALILGCDSMLELDGHIFGKPDSAEVAASRWRTMRGKQGTLHTGHWVIDARDPLAPAAAGRTASTVVRFAQLSDTEIDSYVATGEPLRVAGAFTVDGIGGPYVTGIEGDYHNVVGLSLPLLRELLLERGIPWHTLRA